MMRSLDVARRSRWSRVISVLLLVLQAVVLAGLPLTDARAEARSASATTHVEDTTSAACIPAHEHSACLVCRTLRAFGPTSAAATPPPVTAGPGARAMHRCIDPDPGARVASIRPRAPPAR